MSDKTREQRIHDIVYSCDHRPELAERIVSLEDERDFWHRQAADMYLHVTGNLLEAVYPIDDGIYPSIMVMAAEQGTTIRLEELEAENARLVALCESMRCALVGFGDETYLKALDETLERREIDVERLIDGLKPHCENDDFASDAELRGLAYQMSRCIQSMNEYINENVPYERGDKSYEAFLHEAVDGIMKRVRELGIEVYE